MRQFSCMIRRHRAIASLALLALGGCSLPGPYQTYSPGAAPPPPPRLTALTVYGATTTTPENEIAPIATDVTPTPPVAAPPPASATQTPVQRIAICYSRLWNSADAVHSAAAQACGKSAPRLVSQSTDLDACPALTPTHAVFACGQ